MVTPGDRVPDLPDDDDLLARLASLVRRVDPVPDAVRSYASTVLAMRTIDDRLGRLLSDSADRSRPVGARSGSVTRVVEYDLDGARLEVGVDGDHVVGWLEGAVGATIEIVSPSGSRQVRTDEYGEFRSANLPPGPFRLRVVGATPVSTDWLLRPRS